MAMRVYLCLSAALALAACSQEKTEQAGPAPEETMMPVEPDGGIGDGAGPIPAEPEPTQQETPDIAEPPLIPADYHGVWDYVDGTCQPESDLRMEISGERIVFYESVGEVTNVASETNGDRIVTLAMSGEGETWASKLRLQMDSRGMRMVVLPENGEESSAADRQYSARKRCS